MSHVVKLDIVILNLDALARAAEACGCTLNLGQTKYRWYGHHVGDYPFPEGMNDADIKTCDHAISVKNNPNAYEVGVKVAKVGEGYVLLMDFWGSQGKALENAIGERGKKLSDYYAAETIKQAAIEQGIGYTEEIEADGTIRIIADV